MLFNGAPCLVYRGRRLLLVLFPTIGDLNVIRSKAGVIFMRKTLTKTTKLFCCIQIQFC